MGVKLLKPNVGDEVKVFVAGTTVSGIVRKITVWHVHVELTEMFPGQIVQREKDRIFVPRYGMKATDRQCHAQN